MNLNRLSAGGLESSVELDAEFDEGVEISPKNFSEVTKCSDVLKFYLWNSTISFLYFRSSSEFYL